MKVSEEELLLLTEEPDYEKAALKILKQGPRIVAVTLGEKRGYDCNTATL
ncbi:MAG: hypothetical protein ACLR6I_12805 [Waltera sp.]